MPDASSDDQLAPASADTVPADTGAGVFAGISPARSLWPHQERALRAFSADQAAGDRSTYLVVPPGGGKTMIGLECARRAGRPTLVLCPNTAIQAQWIGQWHAQFARSAEARAVGARATASRDLPTPLTVLTYQAVASFDPAGGGSAGGDGPAGGDGDDSADAGAASSAGATLAAGASSRPGRGLSDRELLASLHPNGQRLLATLKAAGPATLVLDECHHLLELWGRLLLAIVGELPDPWIIGLTATPPHLMTTEQAGLHRELFGTVDLEVSAPALVRDGHLAPYQELAWFTTPTPAEADYIGGQALRFAELRAGLVDPGFASVPFLAWLQQRVVERRVDGTGAQLSWEHFAKDQPALADAGLRLYCDGMLPLPDGAAVREQHRHPPTAEDWVALIGDYCRHCLLPGMEAESRDAVNPDAVNPDAGALDKAAYEAIRTALPSIGYRLTRAGIRAAASPVDRVLARSASKATAAAEILRAEHTELGDQLRALVLTDFAVAGGIIPATLAGVLDEGAGGALLTLRSLLEDEVTAGLDPVLMTGQRVACGADTAAALVAWLGEAAPELAATASAADPFGVATVSGGAGWEPRRYVPLVTRFFTEGGARALVGTRALLGEGWDAPAVNVTVDLTAATTPTAVVQARGRALRRDAGWPEKVADNWAVVCVTDAHPKGAADYNRFVRKHDRYFALAPAGDIASGVSHVDPDLSPFEPPAVAAIAELNARMLIRAGERASSRELWRIGTPYADEPVATVVVASGRPLGLGRAAVPAVFDDATVAGQAVTSRHGRIMRALLAAAWFVLGVTARRARAAIEAPASGSFADMAAATADALRDAGLVSRGAAALRIEPRPDGEYRARLADVPAAESATFAGALDEVLSPLAHPRYIVPRLFVAPPADERAARRLARGATRLSAAGNGVAATVVYHAVPTVLGANAKLARAFAAAWNARVSPGEMLYTGSPEGTGILVAQRGDDPFDVTTQIRTLWR
jgi:superfamily II DNA or RNA helicase